MPVRGGPAGKLRADVFLYRARGPADADRLIWDKNTNGVVRLCQKKAGRRPPVREVQHAPQTIVLNNGTETVHLLYDFTIDRRRINAEP